MKFQHPIWLAICLAVLSFSSTPLFADAPQPGVLSMALTHNVVSLGEPIVLKYKLTNAEGQRLSVNIDNDQKWLTMELVDAKGSIMQASDEPITRRRMESDIALDSGDYYTNYIVIKHKFQPAHSGLYYVLVSTHLFFSWQEGLGEKSVNDQKFFLPLTVTAKNPKRLHEVAEALRQTASHASTIAEYQSAIKALFSMQDASCQPVWKELATDPTLDAYRAIEAAQQLADVNSADASDLLIEMQATAPERWAVTGTNPLDALEKMRKTANPDVREHINQLLVNAGVELNHKPIGSTD